VSTLTRIGTAVVTAVALAFAGAATPSEGASSGYRFVVTPIVPIEHSDFGVDFDIYVRLNRALPRLKSGKLDASLLVADRGGDGIVSTLGRKAGRCYGAPVDPSFTKSDALKHPRVGRLVTVKLVVKGKVVATRQVRLTRAKKARGEDQDAPYAAALGC
jgi:hypothetical protein